MSSSSKTSKKASPAKPGVKKAPAPRARKAAVAEAPVALETAPAAVVETPLAPPAPPKPALSKGVVMTVVAVLIALVGLEVTVLMKGKIDRTQKLIVVSKMGQRGGPPNQAGKFWGQWVVKADSLGRVLVVDHAFNKVLVWQAADGKHLQDIDAAAVQKETFSPRNLEVDASGNIYILDKNNAEVVMVGPDLAFAGRFPVTSPGEIALGPKGEIYVADGARAEVIQYDREGNVLARFGRHQLVKPHHMGTDSRGQIYVLDVADAKVKIFTPAGQFKKAFKVNFKKPYDYTVMQVRNDTVYVTQLMPAVIWGYTLQGQLKEEIAQAPCEPFDVDSQGRFFMSGPEGIYVLEKDK